MGHTVGSQTVCARIIPERVGEFTSAGHNGSSLHGRDQLETAIRLLKTGDELLALHPDRLARDTSDLLSIAKRVIACGATLQIRDLAITSDGSDLMAEVMLTAFGVVGMIEKHFIRACQMRGIEVAKAAGVYKGRPATIDTVRVRELHATGMGATQIARELRIGRTSVYRVLAA